MRCNSLDEQTILLRLFGNRALYLIFFLWPASHISLTTATKRVSSLPKSTVVSYFVASALIDIRASTDSCVSASWLVRSSYCPIVDARAL